MYDAKGNWIPARRDPLGRHCGGCGRIFAQGTVPLRPDLEGNYICRDCRDSLDSRGSMIPLF